MNGVNVHHTTLQHQYVLFHSMFTVITKDRMTEKSNIDNTLAWLLLFRQGRSEEGLDLPHVEPNTISNFIKQSVDVAEIR